MSATATSPSTYTALVKQAAAGRWVEILRVVGGCPSEILDGKHHACPKCGGTDRFRLIEPEAGALFCNQCFNAKNGDGFAALQWLCGFDFLAAVRAVASHLGMNGHGDCRGGNGKPKIVATYDYREASGTVVFQVVRFEPKDFRQRRPKDGGGWEWNVKGCPIVPYRLPELLKADAAAVVWIVEGERDVDNLASRGLIGTCNAGGAGKWRPEHAEHLAGRPVVILPDNDESGRKHAQQVARSLQGLATSVKIIELPGLPEKGDVSDWLAAGGTAEQLREMVDAVPDAEPPEPPAFVRVLTTHEFMLLDLEHNYLIRDVAIQGQPGGGGGRSKTCKTLVFLEMAVAVASGTPFLGSFEVPQAAPVGFFSYESGGATMQRHLLRIGQARGLTADDIASLPIYWQFQDRVCLSDPEHLEAMGELVSKHDLKLLIVDPLYLTLFGPGEMPKSGDLFYMGQRLAGLGDLCRKTGVTLYVLHHFRKSGVKDDEEPAGLEELSMSGLGEFVRQWLLLQRRTPYANDGHHELWARVGGSAGHAGLYALTINEGLSNGQAWAMEVQRVGDARAEIRAQRDSRRAAELERKDEEYRRRLLEALRQFPDGDTAKAIRITAGLNPDCFGKAIMSLLAEGRVETCEVVKNKRSFEGYRPCKT